jgi:hypothetical protein
MALYKFAYGSTVNDVLIFTYLLVLQSPTVTVERRLVETGDNHSGSSPLVITTSTTTPSEATPGLEDDRNIFKKYKLQFGSIGNSGRSTSRDDASGWKWKLEWKAAAWFWKWRAGSCVLLPGL